MLNPVYSYINIENHQNYKGNGVESFCTKIIIINFAL